MTRTNVDCDLLIVGGGINGAGIARDASGRGLRVMLVEQADLASATSSASSKLIHGGLRYLEQWEFRLVREALREREVLLKLAPHLIRPLNFVLPHDAGMRPAWMVRAGLWLYDHLGGRETLPGSKGVSFPHAELSAGLKPEFRSGYVYADCRVDDSRLVVANAVAAREKGATILTRTRCVGAHRAGGAWEARLVDVASGAERVVRAAGLVNAAGPWATDLLDRIPDDHTQGSIRLVKGSHIVVPRVHSQGHAYIFQNDDKRVIFVIPYEGRFSLIGTTDVPVSSLEQAKNASGKEIDYLLRAANRFLARPLTLADVVWTYAGVRPLYDDGTSDPSQVSRDYVTKIHAQDGAAPLLTLFGGKITTYRTLAEGVLAELEPFFPWMGAAWTSRSVLPGGDVPHFNAFRDEMQRRYPRVGRDLVEAVTRRHGSRAADVLGEAARPEDLGRHFGGGLTEREVEYFRSHEWASSAEDLLWRRTKCGLHMSEPERASLAEHLAASARSPVANPAG